MRLQFCGVPSIQGFRATGSRLPAGFYRCLLNYRQMAFLLVGVYDTAAS
jgi:hypothetical protein